MRSCGWLEELTLSALPSLGLSAWLNFLSTLVPQATMKKDKSHGGDEADCRAELILINGDCTDPPNDEPALLLEANGKPSTPGESFCAVPRMHRGAGGQGSPSHCPEGLLGGCSIVTVAGVPL